MIWLRKREREKGEAEEKAAQIAAFELCVVLGAIMVGFSNT
jgi:hypothetical protein